MVENAFMMVDAWEKMIPRLIEGLRNINRYVAANPQWLLLEIFDGFSAHLLSHKANQERLDANILSLKEEGDNSDVCQLYDKHVTKGDKSAKARSLSFMLSGFYVTKKIIDQWILVNIGMYAVRNTKPECWTASFDACNVDPRTRVSFGEWCQRIGHFLQGGESFKPETIETKPSTEEVYAKLPHFWHAIYPDGKTMVVAVCNLHVNRFRDRNPNSESRPTALGHFRFGNFDHINNQLK
jgi:hypothetical protein